MLYRAVLVAASFVAGATQVSALWPLPQNLTEGTTTLRLSPGFHITLGSNIGWNAPLDLYDAIGRTQAHLFTDNLGRLIVGRGASDADSLQSAAYLTELQLSLESGAQVNPITTESQKPLTQRDEAYTLTVPSDGSRATITANSTLGLYRGLTTFQQLWYEYQGTIYAYNTPVQIQDQPAYVSFVMTDPGIIAHSLTALAWSAARHCAQLVRTTYSISESCLTGRQLPGVRHPSHA